MSPFRRLARRLTSSIQRTMIGRLTRAADFERLLATPPRRRSAHFAVHHVMGVPARVPRGTAKPAAEKLSTACEPNCPNPVDDSACRHWLGCIVPKRHARRAVTRNVVERQIRAAAQRHEADLPAGLWLVRLRQPFAPADFRSADSRALRAAAQVELDGLFAPRARRPQHMPAEVGRP